MPLMSFAEIRKLARVFSENNATDTRLRIVEALEEGGDYERHAVEYFRLSLERENPAALPGFNSLANERIF